MSGFPPSFADKFGVILCDPPWAFRTYAGNDRTPTQKTDFREAEDHYPTMSFEEMAALPVADIAAKNCALIMWVVGSHIPEAVKLGEAWGFTFKTDVFYWFKQKLINADQIDLFTGDIADPRISMGYYTRKQVEPAFLFTRGKPVRRSKGVRQAIITPTREHSRKPDEQYDRCEALFDGPYLEMFARQSRPGWDCWGNQSDKFDVPILEETG